MTKCRGTVSRWSRLAVAALVPLVLTVCATPPLAVKGISQPGEEITMLRLSAAKREAEPVSPPQPMVEIVRIAAPDELGPVADLVGIGQGSRFIPHEVEPVFPPLPTTVLNQREVLEKISVPVLELAGGVAEPEVPLFPTVVMAQRDAPSQPGAPSVAGRDGSAVAGRDGSARTEEPTATPPPAVATAHPTALTEPQPVGGVGPLLIQASTDADFDAVRVVIALAEEVGAGFYDPENLQEARTALRTSERIRSFDPGGSHIALLEAAVRARAAFDNSVRLAAERLRLLLADRIEELREIQANRWLPVSFSELITNVQRAEDLFQTGDLFGAYRLALNTAQAMVDLRDSLITRLDAVHVARAETEWYLDEAQKVDAHRWAAKELEQLNALYLVGLEAMQGYRLADAEEAFGSAVEIGKLLMRMATERLDTTDMDRAAELLISVQEEIEEASQLNVVTDTGEWIKPDLWSGQAVLDALRGGTAQREEVLAGIDFEDSNALRRAQALWVEGVVEHDASNYGQAIELFLVASRYVEVYKVYAVKTVYTVRLIPERRDCLWRIAEYDFIYGDPFLWPKIWRRNRELIQNPDLIHPGWQLIIPAL